jgi:hypothetical protein
MAHWAKTIRAALIYGVLAGIFGMLVILIAFFVGGQLTRTGPSAFVGSVLSFLIIGGAARKLAIETKVVGVGWRMGALAGGLSELIGTMGSAVVLSLTPAAQATFARLARQQQHQASDPGALLANLVLDLAVVMVFGALFGTLGAWSAHRFGPPSNPKA